MIQMLKLSSFEAPDPTQTLARRGRKAAHYQPAARGAALVALFALFPAAASAADSESPAAETCAASALSLEEPYESVQVGGRALAADSVLGGPPECVASVSSDSQNVRATLRKKGEFASVRIWALHEGFANVTVTSTDGVQIGVVRVSVYPREPRAHKGGR